MSALPAPPAADISSSSSRPPLPPCTCFRQQPTPTHPSASVSPRGVIPHLLLPHRVSTALTHHRTIPKIPITHTRQCGAPNR
ncbi:hypothetical protein B0H16DRAFT_1719282 [Mycena metata]|uniref:Uncharacterized protein n=1 Tax=Mycena metata TaxID=1033252 RepID=A0AAD7NIK9_9AGAR|nr:hypothetical protein B0H16DRAFT_1719282 [Mycena metata]